MGHISLWSLTDIRCMLKCIQNSTPMRHKATHFINVPTYANKVFEFFIGLLNEKLKSRINVSIFNVIYENSCGHKYFKKLYVPGTNYVPFLAPRIFVHIQEV